MNVKEIEAVTQAFRGSQEERELKWLKAQYCEWTWVAIAVIEDHDTQNCASTSVPSSPSHRAQPDRHPMLATPERSRMQ
jgi:hypothetical protein